MIDDKMPIFVCKRCGNIIRAIAYEEYDVYNCRICNFKISMNFYIYTSYRIRKIIWY